MQTLELKIPPPIILVVSMVLAFLCSRYLPEMPLPMFVPGIYLGFILLGCGICLAGIWQFSRANTTIDPTKPEKTQQLVSNGIFSITRNPMYLGMALILIGSIIKFNHSGALLALVFFVLYITYFQIKPEERIIQRLFGQAYQDYKNTVRRWL
jgi:protein-S-isoprenylcysteine O-methyltransferase Ste14